MDRTLGLAADRAAIERRRPSRRISGRSIVNSPNPAIAASTVASVSLVLAVCLVPLSARMRFPSLYADDVVRIEQLQTTPLRSLLFLPFNEHMAPLFQAVSWITWQIAGRSLARAPLASTVASYVPFWLTLGMLAWVVRRETRSGATALAAVAIFSISWLAIEVVYWYSASSFTWALLMTLVAWAAAGASGSGLRRRFGLPAVAIASALAPAFSAIGLLAGPVAAVRGAIDEGRLSRRCWAIVAPAAGLVAYLLMCGLFRHHDVVASSLQRQANFGPGLAAAARAPMEALVPALFGVPVGRGPALALGLALCAAALTGLAWQARRCEADRPLVIGGLVLVYGGYALAFCARPDEPGHPAIQTQRYHLFPMLGLVFLLAPTLRRVFSRLDVQRVHRLWAVLSLAVALLLSHQAEVRGRGRFFRHVDQVRTLAALDRLGAVCAELGVTRRQALAALDPIETEWTPKNCSALTMIAPGPAQSLIADACVKSTLLAALSFEERQSICGGMDASPYLRPVANAAGVVAVGRLVKTYRVIEKSPGRYETPGYPAFAEYVIEGSPTSAARAIGFTGAKPGEWIEFWWRGDQSPWSETRSIRLRPPPPPELAAAVTSLRLPRDCLPHWNPAEASRFRVLYHTAGEVALEAPRLLR